MITIITAIDYSLLLSFVFTTKWSAEKISGVDQTEQKTAVLFQKNALTSHHRAFSKRGVAFITLLHSPRQNAQIKKNHICF